MAYVTTDEIRESKVGFDFTNYEDSLLELLETVAVDLIEKHTNRIFGAGAYTDNGSSIIDYEGRLLIKFKNYPVDAITDVQVWVTGMSDKIALNTDNIALFTNYAYVPTAIGDVAEDAYPSRIVSLRSKLFYQVTYSVVEDVPETVKRAVCMVVANLLKADYYAQEAGMSGSEDGVSSFKSGEYEVKFNKPSTENVSDSLLTNTVKVLLRAYTNVGISIA